MKQSLNNKDVMHEMGLPFYPFAKWYHIEVDVTDLDYIVNVIKKDKCFHLILQAYLMEDEIANKLAYFLINFTMMSIVRGAFTRFYLLFWGCIEIMLWENFQTFYQNAIVMLKGGWKWQHS